MYFDLSEELMADENAILNELAFSADSASHRSNSFKNRNHVVTMESFDSQNDEFVKGQLNMITALDEDEMSEASDSDQLKFENLLASIPQLLKRNTESSARFFATKFINNLVANVVSGPKIKQLVYEKQIRDFTVAFVSNLIEVSQIAATNTVVHQINQSLIHSPDLEFLVNNVQSPFSAEAIFFSAEKGLKESDIAEVKLSGAPLSFQFVKDMDILQQRSFLYAMSTVMKQSIISVVDEGIPMLEKVIEAEFIDLSDVFSDLETFIFNDLKGYCIVEDHRSRELSKILDYGHNCIYTEHQQKSLLKVLLNTEKKLKRRFKKVSERLKSYYEKVDGRIIQMTKACSGLPIFKANPLFSSSIQKKLIKFDMTTVIDFLRVGKSDKAVEEIHENCRKFRQSSPSKSFSGIASTKVERKREQIKCCSQHVNKQIEEFISTRLRYEESKKLSESTKELLENHLSHQIQGVESLMRVLENGETIFNASSIEHGIDEDHVTGVERNGVRVSTSNILGKRNGESVSSFRRERSDRKSTDHMVRDIVSENKREVGHWTSANRETELHRSKTHELLGGLDLSLSQSRFAYKQSLPSLNSRPATAGDLTTTELKTLMQKLGYVEFDFDRPISPISPVAEKRKSKSPQKPLVDNLHFYGKPSGKFALTPHMIEQYKFSTGRVKKNFENFPINLSDKKKKMERNRVSDMTLSDRSRGHKQSRSPMQAQGSDDTFKLDQFLLGQQNPSPRKNLNRNSAKLSKNRSELLLNEVPMLKESPDHHIKPKLPDGSQLTRLSSHDLRQLPVMGDEIAKVDVEESDKTNLHRRENFQNSQLDVLHNNELDMFHEPVLWTGDDEVNTVTFEKVHSHQMLDFRHQVYYQSSEEPFVIHHGIHFHSKNSEWFNRIGVCDEIDHSLKSDFDIITEKADHALHNIRAVLPDAQVIRDDWEILSEEVRQFNGEVVELLYKLKPFLNSEFIHPFSFSLNHSKLIRKESEWEILELFIKNSLESSRLQSLGVLPIPVEYFDVSTQQHKLSNVHAQQHKNLHRNVSKFAEENSLNEIEEMLKRVPSVLAPFRINQDVSTSATQTLKKSKLLQSKPRSILEQQIDHSFQVISNLRRQLLISVLNLMEMICANVLFPMVFIMSCEAKHIKISDSLKGLQESIDFHVPFKTALDDFNLSCLRDHEALSTIILTNLMEYDIDDYVLEKERYKSKIIEHGIFQLEQYSKAYLAAARETSALIFPSGNDAF